MTDNVFMDYREWLTAQKMPAGRRKALLAGLRQFAANGYDGTSTQQIADAAGISQATIFKYFKTKQDLLDAIITPILENLAVSYQRSFVEHLPTTVSLRDVVHYIVIDRSKFIRANADAIVILMSRFLTSADMRQEFNDQLLNSTKRNDALKLGKGILNQLIVSGQVRAEITLADLIRVVVGQLGAYFVQRYLLNNDRPVDTDRDLQVLEDTIYYALAR